MKTVGSAIQNLGKTALICFLVGLTALKGPELHYNYIRGKVQKTSVYVTNEARTSGGSGSHVIAPSGKVYIITNAHVCAIGKDSTIFITDDYGNTIPRKILEISKITDLCLIEPLPNYHGALKIGSEVTAGQIVAAIGHPSLMPTTMSRGEVIGAEVIDVFDHYMDPLDSNDKCDLPKNKILEIESFFGPLKVCTVHINATLTTATSLPGSSGSPLVDFYGNLVGVVFAGNRANWALAVTLSDVTNFLKSY